MIVYKITNVLNGKVYIGKTTTSLGKRIKRHLYHVRKGTNRYLYDAINCYGWRNFQTSCIESCSSLEKLNQAEIKWIATFSSTDPDKGYNMTPGGEGGQLPAHILKKIAESKKGIPLTESHKENISRSLKGRKGQSWSDETREKIIAKKKGKMPKRPIAQNMVGKVSGFSGKKHTENSKKKISQHLIGKSHHSEIHKQSLSQKMD